MALCLEGSKQDYVGIPHLVVPEQVGTKIPLHVGPARPSVGVESQRLGALVKFCQIIQIDNLIVCGTRVKVQIVPLEPR